MAILFKTQRLTVVEVTKDYTFPESLYLLDRIPQILTPTVVENLPPYFHDIISSEHARVWLDRMLLESRLLKVEVENHKLIGFLFVYVERDHCAHIGYLLDQEYWGKGLASELLQGFITHVAKSEPWRKLVGGVGSSNIVSAKLLTKLGFIKNSTRESNIAFYEYTIAQ